jgi:hypothetical protein
MLRDVLPILIALFIITVFLNNTLRQDQAVPTTSAIGGFGGETITIAGQEDCIVPDSLTNTRAVKQDLFGMSVPVYNSALQQIREMRRLQRELFDNVGKTTIPEFQQEGERTNVGISTFALNNYLALNEALRNDRNNLRVNILDKCTDAFIASVSDSFNIMSVLDRAIASDIIETINMQSGTQ